MRSKLRNLWVALATIGFALPGLFFVGFSADAVASPSASASVSGARILAPATNAIIDSNQNSWQIVSGKVMVNGAPAGFSGGVVYLLYLNGLIYQENQNHEFWFWQASSWVGPVGDPRVVSPDGTNSTGAASIIDSQLNIWSLSSGRVYENGAPTAFAAASVSLLFYVNSTIYLEDAHESVWTWSASPGWSKVPGVSTVADAYASIINQSSGLCLDFNVGSSAARLFMNHCSSASSSQRFYLHLLSGSQYEIVNAQSSLCVYGNGSQIQPVPCAGSPGTRFSIAQVLAGGGVVTTPGVFQLIEQGTGFCLTGSASDSLQAESCSTGAMTGFTLAYFDGPKMFFAHHIPIFGMTTGNLNGGQLGTYYPLNLIATTSAATNEQIEAENVSEMQAAMSIGINGFSVDTQPDIVNAMALLKSADQVPGFQIAPCLDFSAAGGENPVTWAVGSINQYLAYSKGHISAAKYHNKYVIASYGSGPTAEQWAAIKSGVAAAGTPILLIGDLNVNFNGAPTAATIQAEVETNAANYDLSYNFLGILPTFWSDFIAGTHAVNVPFGGGMMPGYYRGYGVAWPFGPFSTDPVGTQVYRNQLSQQLSSSLPMWFVSTWNDFIEHTTVDISSDWSSTRSDLTAWYAALFRGAPPPFGEVKLYVTSPHALYLNQSQVAEALVINPSSAAVTVNLQLRDPQGANLGPVRTAAVAPLSVGAVTLTLNFSTAPSSPTLYAVGWTTSPALSVTSAPISIYPVALPADFHAAMTDYSLASDHLLSLSPRLSVSASSGQLQFNLPATANILYADVLHDGNKVSTLVNPAGPQSIALDSSVNASVNTNDDYYESYHQIDHHTYVLRLIDSAYNVQYSAPFDPTQIGSYAFNGSGADGSLSAHNASVRLSNGFQELSDGSQALATSPSNWANLPFGLLTQQGGEAFSIETWVRPDSALWTAASGGVIFGDTAGFVLGLKGNSFYLMHYSTASESWCTVSAPGKSGISAGNWAHVAATYDRQNLNLYLNGNLVSQGACTGPVVSAVIAIGTNPASPGNNNSFVGLIKSFQIFDRALSAAEILRDASQAPAVP